jgi:putative DNA primase/helicase
MNFLDFARAHGLRVNSITPGKWMAVPTDDHPNKRNGRYKFLGDVGWVQNWATMVKPEIWRGQEGLAPYSRRPIVEDRSAELAAKKAGWILHQCVQEKHPYLEKKGFQLTGNVWNELLVIPMRAGANIIGCQLIDHEGTKKFLKGQKTKGASFVIDAKGIPIFCEGYATGLSIREAMQAMKIRYRIIVCFSAGNLENIARSIDGGVVVADHDLNGVGEDAARRTRKPYWISDTPGEDFNDFHVRAGLFKAMLSLKRVLTSHKIAS